VSSPVDPVDPVDPVEQHGALFRRDGEGFAPTPLGRGPWDPHALHGGAPSALLAYLLSRHDPGPASFVARLTIELLRPVPLAPLQVAARTIRPGKKVQWLEGALLHDGREVARATALRLRVRATVCRQQASSNRIRSACGARTR
jgi:Thioesterase-like superfamily